jgi:hypothetical protein
MNILTLLVVEMVLVEGHLTRPVRSVETLCLQKCTAGPSLA